MISILKEKLNEHKTLVTNFTSLFALQSFNLLLPLITYPYLMRTLGKETYGLVIYAQAIITYLQVIVVFGFNISATKEISINRNDKRKISIIVSNVLFVKIILFILTFILLGVMTNLIPILGKHYLLFYMSMWICLHEAIFPLWYFQGIEKMKYITYVTIVGRLFFLVFVFIIIKSKKDYLLLPMINGVGALITGIISLYVIFKKHDIRFVVPSFNEMKYYVKDSLPFFMTDASIKFYVNINIVLVGSFLSISAVSYYDLGEKVLNILKIPQSLLGQTIFPKVSKDKNTKFVMKVLKFSLIANSLLVILTVICSKYIVLTLGGYEMLPATKVVQILSVSALMVVASNIFGVQILIPNGEKRLFTTIIVLSGLFYLMLFLFLWYFDKINIYSISIIAVLTEVFVTISMYITCKKKGLIS